MKTNLPQTDYTAMTNGFQLVMPLDCEVNIEKNAPVRLLNAIMERMDYSKLYAAYMRNGQLKPGYLNTLFVRTAVSGFAVMAAGTLLFLGLIPVCFPHAVLSYELEEIGGLIMPFLETVAQAENWFAYFGFYTLLIGISGVFWGVLALTVSAWVDNTYAIYIFPILFLYAMDYAAPNLHLYSLSGQMFAMYYYETWQQALLYPLVTFGSMSVLCYLAFIYRGRRNCRES